MNKLANLEVAGIAVRKSEELYCLNDLHKAAGGESKHQPSDWLKLQSTSELIEELSSGDYRIINPIKIIRGKGKAQGTYACKELVYAYAMWISPKFNLAVIRAYDALVNQTEPAYEMPYHLKRYLANSHKIPHTHFSILNEMQLALIAPLERAGYILPEKLVPDISEGKVFCKWLRDNRGVDTDSLPKYKHEYADGRVVSAKMYPLAYLADFRTHFNEVWLPKYAPSYFSGRDKLALTHVESFRPRLAA